MNTLELEIVTQKKVDSAVDGQPDHTQPNHFPHKYVEQFRIGGRDLLLKVQDVLLLSYREVHDFQHAVIVKFVSGYHPALGLPISGWSGSETVILYDIYGSALTGQRNMIRELDRQQIRTHLEQGGIKIQPPSQQDRVNYYSSRNTDRPHMYFAMNAQTAGLQPLSR